MAFRPRSPVRLLLAAGLLATACGSPGAAEIDRQPSLGEDPSEPATETSSADRPLDAGVDDQDTTNPPVAVALPPIPAVALPDISVLGQTGDVVAERLGELVTPTSGVELVAADCAAEGGELVFQGSATETDVFAIEQDGSGIYREERDDGLVTLEVEADGSGRYYEERGQALITIEVAADGSGTYFQRQGGGLVTVERAADGTGTYYDDRDGLVTIVLRPDGSGQYYREIDEELLTIEAGGDGSGEFFWRRGDDVSTLDVGDDGGWTLSEVKTDHRLELRVAADGSGRYTRTGLDPVAFDFDPTGRAADGHIIEVPQRPVLAVAGRFPPLGNLGSLAPPCAAVIRLDASLLFEFDEATIRPEADSTLDEVAAALIEAGKPIEINGHTDAKGSEEYNLELSLERAQAVEQALRQRGLTTPIEVNGFGESQPVAPNETPDGEDDPAGRALNRRVEIVVPEGA